MKLHIHFNRLLLCKTFLFLSNFLILYILSNFYPPAVPGQFYYQISIISIVAMSTSLGIDNSIFYFLKRKILTISNILAIASRLFLFFLLLILIYGVLANVLFVTVNYEIAFSLLFICSLLLQYIINAYFLHIEKGWVSQMCLMIINLIFIGFLFFNSAAYTVKNAGTLLNIYFSLFFLISLFTLLYISYKNFEKVALPSKQYLKLLLKFSRYPYITNALFFFGANVDLIAVKIFCSQDLSTYVQSVKIFQLFCSVTYLLYYPFMGKIIEKNYKDGVQYLAQSSRIVSLVLLVAIIPFLFLCYFFLGRFFPVNSSRIMTLLGYFSISFFSVSLAYFYTSYFVASKMTTQNLISASIFFISIIISSFSLVPFLGIKGGAIAYGISMVLSLVFDITCFLKINKLNLADIFFIKKVDIILMGNNLGFLK